MTILSDRVEPPLRLVSSALHASQTFTLQLEGEKHKLAICWSNKKTERNSLVLVSVWISVFTHLQGRVSFQIKDSVQFKNSFRINFL